MGKKALFWLVLIFSIIFNLNAQEYDYSSLFKKINNYMGPVDMKAFQTQSITNNEEVSKVIENGLYFSDLLAPYTASNINIKSTINKLAYFKFNLRSVQNVQIYQKAVRSIVLIVAPEIGSGDGFIINNESGIIVTNYHVTCGLKNILVAFYNENIQDPSKLKFIPAEVFRYSAKRDIAFLKLKSIPKNLQKLNINELRIPAVGEEVHTIGHPLSLVWTYSHGLITAVRNKFKFGKEESADIIQIDANISPGNSGGPLLDEKGNVIGLVTFSIGAENAQNLNFAISSKEIKRVLNYPQNEETSSSGLLKKLYGVKLISFSELQNYKFYRIDENKDGKIDYISVRDPNSNKEEYRYLKEIEIEIESGKMEYVNILGMDISKDGIIDTSFVDINRDGQFDLVMIDIDQDGQPDIIGMDTEGRGIITQAWLN